MEMRVLQFSWPLPPQKQYYRTKPTRYVSHLIGHESAGSVRLSPAPAFVAVPMAWQWCAC